jgi:hypothetical protein
MHPNISTLIASQRADEVRRLARHEADLIGDGWPASVAGPGAFSRYFKRAREAHFQPLRRTGRGAR